ncbi:uncharacterized protein LOC116538877 [Sapajus apella]|uniref:Uncharacterized protein LOC116538877 n=1 Tax=Sapajus apella TaxID=9515 RepID=A0A6J3GH20_SAPAP|nr:uncharacterized protein LOC116538877 [Sapajus apella]
MREELRLGRNRIAIGLRERLHFLSALLRVWPCGQVQIVCSDDSAASRPSSAWKISPHPAAVLIPLLTSWNVHVLPRSTDHGRRQCPAVWQSNEVERAWVLK